MPRRTKSISLLLVATALSLTGNIYAEIAPVKPGIDFSQQDGKVTGTVVDSFGPVTGASVIIKGTTNGNITDLDGKFTLEGLKNGDVIQISYIGYATQEIPYTGQPSISVTLAEDSEQLEEVVVTALGIKRSEKSLGYAMQEVKGDDLVQARETNLANALTGKVSGVQIIRSSNGAGGSSKIQLRGSNSVTGLNQPLIVVDGVPMDNFTGADNNDMWNPSIDMGNGLSDINPEDIESMSVLKGASAAALYGSRAGNGVILITTKQGRENPGLGITISGSVSAETIFMKPERQTTFGQGTQGLYDGTSSYSWGPRIEGQSYTDWEGNTQNMTYYDNIDNYFNTGINTTESFSFSQMYNKTSIYASATRMDDANKIPSAKLHRTNMTLRASSTFGKDDRWSFDGKIQYINTIAKNRPLSGNNDSNTFLTMYTTPISLDITDFKNNKDANGDMRWWQRGSGLNPYWAQDYNLNQDSRNRFLMNASLKYKFTDWLNAEIKAGSDMYFTETETKLYDGSPLQDNGRYSTGEQKFYENNYSFLITAQKDNVFGKWGGTVTFGGNLMERRKTGLKNSLGKLTVPDQFWITNGDKGDLSQEQTFENKKINSLYGTLGINYDGWVFLDGTFRNDWSSALSKKNRSFFYPSVSVSWVISDMMNKIDKNMPDWFTYAKVRASFAQVGNDLDPYQLYNLYKISTNGSTGGIMGETNGTVLYNEDVRSELIKSWEAGFDIRFFNNRLGLDAAWYKSNATRQLLDLPMDPFSGYASRKINAGNIQNEGLEISLNGTILDNPAGLSWSSTAQFSLNRNKIKELYEGVNLYDIKTFDAIQIVAPVGGYYGEIYGQTFMRVTDENSPHYGKIVVGDDGLPLISTEKSKVGNQSPDWMMGWTNNFSYKGFNLSFLIDFRIGGSIYSATASNLYTRGNAAGTVVNGDRAEFVVPNTVVQQGSGYAENTVAVTPQNYWERIGSTGNYGLPEVYTYSATNVRLRNITFGYEFNRQMLKKTPFQRVRLSATCNNVWMIHYNLPGIDPESVAATNTNATGFENGAAPTSRSYTFNVTVGF